MRRDIRLTIKRVWESRLVRNIREWFDLIFIILGFVAIGGFLYIPENECVAKAINIVGYVAGIIGLLYVFYALYGWLFMRITFDRRLVKGRFLRKVVCLVILIPSTITTIVVGFQELGRAWGFSEPALQYEEYMANSAHTYADDSDATYDESLWSHATNTSKVFWRVYQQFVDPGNQSETNPGGDRVWISVIAMLGVLLLNGLLVSSIIGWLDSRRDHWRDGSLRYRVCDFGKQRFAVVIGANEIAATVIKNLLSDDVEPGELNLRREGCNDYVLLQTSRDPQQVRDELMSHLTHSEMCRVVIYQALRDSVWEIGKLNVEWATEIYVLGESTANDGGESFHDAMNMRTVNLLVDYLEGVQARMGERMPRLNSSSRRVCKVMFEYQTTYQILQFSDTPAKVKQMLYLIPFNRYEAWARRVMVDGEAYNYVDREAHLDSRIEYLPLEGKGIKPDSDEYVHLVIVGMTKMGMAMGVQAMLQCHYANYADAESREDVEAMSRRRTRITFIDSNAEQEMLFFKGHYSNIFRLVRHRFVDANSCSLDALGPDSTACWIDPMVSDDASLRALSPAGRNFLDIEIEFVQGGLESDGVRTYLRKHSDVSCERVRNSHFTIAICQEDTSKAIASALYMPVEVYSKVQQVWVYQRESADIALNLSFNGRKDLRYANIRPFGMLYGGYMGDRSHYFKAMLLDSIYDQKSLQSVKSRNFDFATFSDSAEMLSKWELLDMDKRFSNLYFVDSIALKLRAVGLDAKSCTVAQIESAFKSHSGILARLEHNRWDCQQLILGYAPCDIDATRRFIEANADKVRAIQTDAPMSVVDDLKKKYDAIKAEYVNSVYHYHPCLRDYSLLDAVDYGAKAYDEMLNNGIATILQKVDRRA